MKRGLAESGRTYLAIRTHPAAQNFMDLADGSLAIGAALVVCGDGNAQVFRVMGPARRARLSRRVVWQSPCSNTRGPFRSKRSLLEVDNHE